MNSTDDVVEDACREVLDFFDADDLSEARLIQELLNTDDIQTEWNSPVEFFIHEFDPERLKSDLTTYIEERADLYPEIAFYAEYGSLRDTTPLTDEEQDYVDSHGVRQKPNQCYANAQLSAIQDLNYFEGLFTTTETPHPTPHSWLEYNGKVVETTHKTDSQAVYWGVPYNLGVVTDALSDRERASALVTDPHQYPPKNASKCNYCGELIFGNLPTHLPCDAAKEQEQV